MNIQIAAVGKLKEKFWKEACAEYLKRLGGYACVSVTEIQDADPAKCGGIEASKEKEGKALLASIPDRNYVILLALDGKMRSSEEIAAHLNELTLHGTSSITFVIGGSNGVSPETAQRADEKLCFGPVTLPHNLARVVLLEQLYRAFRIQRGEPYHK